MPHLFADHRFRDFGPSEYLVDGAPLRATRVEGARPMALRAQVRLLAPKRPGIYGMIDAEEQLLYVGKAKDLRVRLQSYFRRKGRPPKAGRLIAQTRSIVWEVVPSEFAGLLRELELIRRWRPRFNVQGQPLRRRLTFVCLAKPPAPFLYLSRKITPRVQCAFGPIPAGKRAEEAVRRLNDWFQLRDCPEPQEMIFPDQQELFPQIRDPGCLRMDLNTCLGPCTGTCAREVYQLQVQKTRHFLTGNDLSLLQQIEAAMHEASRGEQFERAAELRDRWATLQWLTLRLERLRKAQQEMSFLYPSLGFDGESTWHLIHGARAIGTFATPTDADAIKRAREKITAVYRHRAGLLDGYEHADGMMIVMQWFRKYPQERARCLTPEQAMERFQ